METGETVELTLDNLAHGGDCVGHLADGLAVFVPGGIPGEKVGVKIIKKKKNYLRGQIVNVITSSEQRTEPRCNVFTDCGGCQLQQMDYETQLVHKRQIVRDSMQRIGGFTNIEVEKVIRCDYPWQYRNKAQFPLTKDSEDNIQTGFYRRGTHQIVNNNNCLIQHSLVNRIARKTISILNEYDLSVYNENKHQGLIRHLLVRVGVCTNQAILVIVTSRKQFPAKKMIAKKVLRQVPELVGVLQNINSRQTNVILGEKTETIAGERTYIDYIGSIKFKISPTSFFQVNTLQTKKLYDIVFNFADLTGEETVVDAYCGIGSIALYLAPEAKEVYGIEIEPQAVKNARENAGINGINNCKFISGPIEDILPEIVKKEINPDLVVFDPPRKGIKQEVLTTVLAIKPEKIIYVSCNPATLARDLKRMSDKYEVETVQPVDMFPQTYHIESVTLLKLIV